jgi:hypothetical protein
VILVPTDILRDLPIAADWSDVAAAASKNQALRQKVNKQIAEIWRRRTLKDKDELRRWAMSSGDAFRIYLELLRGAKPKPYDTEGDPLGELDRDRSIFVEPGFQGLRASGLRGDS